MTLEGRLALKEKVFHWLKEGLIRKVQYPEWIANTIPIKLPSGTWKVKVDYSSINKVCAKDMYPLPEEGEELASLIGYPYKCFLRLPKEYIQIRMAEGDEEKTGFHTEEGRMMEKVLADQRGRNVETYLEEIVIKSKSELGLVQDVKETLRKLKRVNIKIDPTMSSFRVRKGRFLGHMVTEEGLREDPGRIQAIILSPTPRSPNQIRSLFLQLTAISKFIPKLAELKHPICEARKRMESTKESGWTNETEEALRRIKMKLSKLQTLKGRNPDDCFLYKPTAARNGNMLHPNRKKVQALIHTTRSLREIFRKYKVKVVTDGPMEETLKLAARERRLGKWATEIRTYDISPEEKMYSYAIRLKFKASNHAMDCEVLLAGLVASANQGMKDLHVFIDSLTLVAQVPNHTSPKKLKPKSKSVNKAGNYEAIIPQLRSIGRYQNKTIDRRDKQQQERQSNKQSTRGKTKLQP
ncbi:hypothetical protein Tco_0215897 [Tanacetum coccineum]